MIDWKSDQSHWLLPTDLSTTDRSAIADAQRRTKWITRHIWIASSGTTRREGSRWVGLPKEAFLSAARALNQHVNATKKDVWLNVLPTYHVGGLSMLSRAFVSGGKVIDLSKQKWNPKQMIKAALRTKATFISLVPTQLFDLVKADLRPPETLRGAFLGGGALDDQLYQQARALGWPILTCYGMTETCAQVATSTLENPKMKILSHAEIETREDRLFIRATSLADFVLKIHPEKGFSLEDPRRDGGFLTEDLGEVKDGFVKVIGRLNDRVKVLGELVSLIRVEEELHRFLIDDFCVLSVPHTRKGQSLIAVVANPKSLRQCEENIVQYHEKSSSLWHLDHWYAIDALPRSALGKVMKAQLLSYLGF